MNAQRYVAGYGGNYLPFDPDRESHQNLQRVVKEEDYITALRGSHAEKAAREGGELLAKISLTLSSERLKLSDLVPKIQELQADLAAAEAKIQDLEAQWNWAMQEWPEPKRQLEQVRIDFHHAADRLEEQEKHAEALEKCLRNLVENSDEYAISDFEILEDGKTKEN